MLTPLRSIPALVLLVVLAAVPAAAQTVDEIIKRGKVIIGVNTTTPIFGLAGKDGVPEGYDPDVARLVGKYLGVQVEFVPVTGANRLPFLLTNRVDMVIALFGITPERAQQIWFSIPYASEAAVLVAPGKRAIKTIDDLAGLKVGVPKGAMQDLIDFVEQMTKINRGRAFYATPERLGEYILVDYVDNKRKQIK